MVGQHSAPGKIVQIGRTELPIRGDHEPVGPTTDATGFLAKSLNIATKAHLPAWACWFALVSFDLPK